MLWRYRSRASLFPGYPAEFKRMFGDFGQNVTKIVDVFVRPHDGYIVFFSGKIIKRGTIRKVYQPH